MLPTSLMEGELKRKGHRTPVSAPHDTSTSSFGFRKTQGKPYLSVTI